MWYIFLLLYNVFCVPLIYLVFTAGAIFNKKIRQGFLARLFYFKKLDESIKHMPAGAKVVLFHSSSVGEWEQAVPIIAKLKEREPELFVVVTFFSPSGYNVVKNPVIDAKVYMPYDSWLSTRRFFARIHPRVWIVCKYDVWPNMLASAKAYGVPVVLSSAELAEDSSRYKFPMRYLNSIFYQKIDRILAISEDTRDRFLKIYKDREHIVVSGDSRYDQIFQKAQRIQEEPMKMIFKRSDNFRIIVGSSWQADEKHYLPALVRLMKKYDQLDAIIVPHEIRERHIGELQTYFENAGIRAERYGAFKEEGDTSCRVAIVDTVGLLAKLYRSSHLAYVGGAFSTGVHNVLEPAAFGQPVLFGPRFKNSHEARKLVDNLSAHSIHNENEFEIIVDYLIQKESLRVDKGNDARRFLEDNLGGTEITMRVLEEMHVI